MRENGKSLVIASFASDSLALGAHWIYDTEQISGKFGRVDSYLMPLPDSYHPTKKKGGFIHYGNKSFVLLKSIADKKSFDLDDFSNQWWALFENYNGYIDKATTMTLSNYSSGKTAENAGSSSNDLADASKTVPLIFCDRQEQIKLIKDVRAQTSMTHGDSATNGSAEFFAMVTLLVLKGASPVKAMGDVIEEQFSETTLSRWFTAGLDSKAEESIKRR